MAAAVILQRGKIPKGLNDSKQMTAETREEAFPRIMEFAIAVGVGATRQAVWGGGGGGGGGDGRIEKIKKKKKKKIIRQATHLAMARAVRALNVAAMFALVDGNDAPALPCPCDTLIDGDARSVSIAAASIIAKVTRDRMMAALHAEHPHYGWIKNKGYGTGEHLAALSAHGPCRHHRRSFAPVHNIAYPQALVDSNITL